MACNLRHGLHTPGRSARFQPPKCAAASTQRSVRQAAQSPAVRPVVMRPLADPDQPPVQPSNKGERESSGRQASSSGRRAGNALTGRSMTMTAADGVAYEVFGSSSQRGDSRQGVIDLRAVPRSGSGRATLDNGWQQQSTSATPAVPSSGPTWRQKPPPDSNDLNGTSSQLQLQQSGKVLGVSNGVRKSEVVLAREAVSPGPLVRAAAAEAATVLQTQVQRGDAVPWQGAEELPSDANFRWAQDSYSKQRRAADIWSTLALLRTRLWLLDQAWSYPGGFTEQRKKERARNTAVWLRGAILELGPTFIKIGQLFSARSDLFPLDFTEELAKLQDRVPAFSSSKAVAIIESELGAPVGTLFRRFEERPIAAASLGQVHRAELHSGEQVVVKVQRPGLRELFDIDLEQLKRVAEQLDRGDEARRDFKGIYAEAAAILYQEIDYIAEGRNADRFRRNFAGEAWVRVPRVFWRYTAPRAITLTYLPGIKISERELLQAAGLDTKLVARRATEAYLIQILKHGFLHSDPHPGNVAVDRDSGALVFYDFGMMARIQTANRELLLAVFYGIYRKDAEAVVGALVGLGIISPASDMLSIRRSIAYFLANFERQTQRQETISAIGEDLFAIALDQPFRFPAAFTFVLRAFATLEGLGRSLDPDYSFAAVARPYAQQLLDLQDAAAQQGFILEQLQLQATRMGTAAAAMPDRIATMDATLASLKDGDLKLRVRVLEGERAARRAGVMQMLTLNTVAAAGLLNVATQFYISGLNAPAGFAAATVAGFGFLIYRGARRIQRLDDFEKNIRS